MPRKALDVYIRKQHIKVLKQFIKEGIAVSRQKGHKYGTREVTELFQLPAKGFIFKSRAKADQSHLHYHAVYDHIRRQAPKFLDHLQKEGKQWRPEIAKLRPHSGRATLITELMGEGLTIALSMKYARHAPGSYKVHLKYSRLTLADVLDACDATRASNPKKAKQQWANMPMKDLLTCQKEITTELSRRHAAK